MSVDFPEVQGPTMPTRGSSGSVFMHQVVNLIWFSKDCDRLPRENHAVSFGMELLATAGMDHDDTDPEALLDLQNGLTNQV